MESGFFNNQSNLGYKITQSISKPHTVLCPICHSPTRPIIVHGHVQCENCKTNFEPCCG